MSRSIVPLGTSPLQLTFKARAVPIASTLLGSLLTTLPVIATAPLLPPFGLLFLIAWRMLRPELWPVWAALPLGLFDDLLSGNPLGTAMLTWTIAFVILDVIDRWQVWRDYWQEWFIASGLIALCLIGGFLVTLATGGGGYILIIVPQLIASILAFPVVVRLTAILDRWRLP